MTRIWLRENKVQGLEPGLIEVQNILLFCVDIDRSFPWPLIYQYNFNKVKISMRLSGNFFRLPLLRYRFENVLNKNKYSTKCEFICFYNKLHLQINTVFMIVNYSKLPTTVRNLYSHCADPFTAFFLTKNNIFYNI